MVERGTERATERKEGETTKEGGGGPDQGPMKEVETTSTSPLIGTGPGQLPTNVVVKRKNSRNESKEKKRRGN
jgi:hypothetical protein